MLLKIPGRFQGLVPCIELLSLGEGLSFGNRTVRFERLGGLTNSSTLQTPVSPGMERALCSPESHIRTAIGDYSKLAQTVRD